METQIKCITLLKSGKRKGEECGCKAKYPVIQPLYCGRHKKNNTKTSKSTNTKTSKSTYIKTKVTANEFRHCVKVKYLRQKYGQDITLEKWMKGENNVYCGRNGRIFIKNKTTGSSDIFHYKKSKYHNPFTVKKYGLEGCLRLYEEHFIKELLKDVKELEGKILGCWCEKDNECHVDIILKYLNNEQN